MLSVSLSRHQRQEAWSLGVTLHRYCEIKGLLPPGEQWSWITYSPEPPVGGFTDYLAAVQGVQVPVSGEEPREMIRQELTHVNQP